MTRHMERELETDTAQEQKGPTLETPGQEYRATAEAEEEAQAKITQPEGDA